MSLSAPTPPDPTTTANAQQGYNVGAATSQQELNMINQSNPYGSLTYNQTGTNPDGTPIYSANQQLSSAQQGLLNTQQTNQGQAGGATSSAIGQLGSQLASGPNLDPSAVTNQLLGWQQNYMQPYFSQQQSNLNSQLQNQGIGQGSEAYQNAQKALGNTQGSTIENAMASDEGQAYNQALSSYTQPLAAETSALGTLGGYSAPASLTSNLTSTPTSSVQPANYAGLAEQNYQSQNQNYDATLGGLFGIGSSALGAIGKAGGIGSLFSDRRLKTDIEQVGTLDNGLPVYRFRYKAGGPIQIGLMAQDVEKVAPDAVHDVGGFKTVNYAIATEAA